MNHLIYASYAIFVFKLFIHTHQRSFLPAAHLQQISCSKAHRNTGVDASRWLIRSKDIIVIITDDLVGGPTLTGSQFTRTAQVRTKEGNFDSSAPGNSFRWCGGKHSILISWCTWCIMGIVDESSALFLVLGDDGTKAF